MPDIRLQDYVAKIRGMIRDVRLDEAISHSRHILSHYPKHIESYCLLGEACLENEMFRESIESFQRALSADPENLIARVGLGVLYDEQGAVPEAIWQLERAFELAPGNAEVRQELQRLYSRQGDGGAVRLKLTRGALGRLYHRNGLYERAAVEFQAVLRKDPDLPDARVALAESLWREGRRLEAVEICLEILEALPNCLKANLIVGEIWKQGGNEEAAEEKLAVARALDPENRIAQEMMGRESPLPLEEVLIPELEAETSEFEPFDPAMVGLAVAADLADEELPEPDALESLDQEELPDWLREVGVTAEEDPALELEDEEYALEAEPDGGPPAEEVPEWLQDFVDEDVPTAVAEPAAATESELVDEVDEADVPEWLDELEAEEDWEDAAPPDMGVSAGVAGLGTGLATGVMVAAGIMKDHDQDPDDIEELPVVAADEVPEWLQELVGPEESSAVDEFPPAIEEAVVELDTPVVEVESPPVEEVPEPEVPASLMALVEAGLLDESDLDAAITGMSVDDLDTQRAEDVPDWLQDLVEAPEGEAIEVEVPVVEAAEVELPVIEADEVELPVIEADEVELPVVEAAEVELPVIEAAEAEMFIVEADEVELPVVEVAEAELPVIEAAEVELPVIEAAEVELPVVEATDFELPVIEAAEVELPVVEAAEFELPVVEAAEAEVAPPVGAQIPEDELELPDLELPLESLPPEEVFVPPVEAAEPYLVEEPVPVAPVEAVPPEGVAVPPEEVAVSPEEVAVPPEEVAAPPEEVAAPPMAAKVEAPSRIDELSAQLKSKPRDYGARLELARQYRDGQDWKAALSQYEKLVSARKLLPKVHEDLESLIEQNVERSRVYQLLGDIDMQQDHLDSALEMYRLARQSLTGR